MSLSDPKAALAASLRRDASMTEAEIKRFLSQIGQVLASSATAGGHGRAVRAAEAATLPLLTDSSMKRARGLIVDIGGKDDDLTEAEVRSAVETIHLAADPQAEILFGAVIDGTLAGEVRVNVFALAFTE